jgi:hypothetical protein
VIENYCDNFLLDVSYTRDPLTQNNTNNIIKKGILQQRLYMFNEDQSTRDWVLSMKGRRVEMALIPLEFKKIPVMKFTDASRYYSALHHKNYAILLIKDNFVIGASYIE